MKKIICSHITNNKKEYFLMIIFFIVGILLGVLYINNIHEEQYNDICGYVNGFIEKFKTIETIDIGNLLKSSIIQNIILGVIIWFFGTTVIRSANSVWSNRI